ncbi:hypothetical protein F5887DRAFT_882410, partial [Amanita rubescens]
LYRISAQLCQVNKPTKPFGGLNILFAGDFAQLPPPIGGENVALYSRTVGVYGTKNKWQDEALGRALWHHVITVVILRQNMRQRQTRITSQLPGKPSITAPEFRFVSIIVAKNAQKDEVNHLGCLKFGQETGQELVDFFQMMH